MALALWALVVLFLSGLSVAGKRREVCDCGNPKRDYSDVAYRRYRAFQNALETSPAFIAAVVSAIVAGAAPYLINLLASVFLVSRLLMAAVHVGTENQPMRSLLYGISWLCIIFMAILAVVAVFAV
jgi:uncharacterized MAPEG superfamily protein